VRGIFWVSQASLTLPLSQRERGLKEKISCKLGPASGSTGVVRLNSQPSRYTAHLDRVREHHVVAVGAPIPFVGEFQRLSFPLIVGRP
jgi:hypothetical protein